LLEGMYSAASGMAAQQQRIDALSNDLANVNTTGYKRVRVAFRDLLYTQPGPGAARGVAAGAGAAAAQVGRTSEQGALQDTGRPLDFAIQGDGFIQVRDRNNRVLLTRDGSLQRRPDGRLVTATGMDTGIRIPNAVNDDDIHVLPDGTVRSNAATYGKLRLVQVRAPEGLQAVGDNDFAPTAASGAPAPLARGTSTTLAQRVLEGSNVDLATAMTDLIDAQRGYEMASKAINTQDRLYEIANQVKR
jgi:flagellar basal-body rod protein FlgG